MRKIRYVVAIAALLAFVIGPAIGSGTSTSIPSNRATLAQVGGGDVGTADTTFGQTPDLSFVATAPCRVVDTRSGGGGRLAANAVRSYRVLDEHPDSPTTFSSQGGNGGPCGLSPLAVAAHISITAVDPSGGGYLRAWPYDEPRPPVPTATILNYSTALNATNAVTLLVCNGFNTDLNNCARDLYVKNFGSSTHLIIDVLGYYNRETYAAIEGSDGSVVDGEKVFDSTRNGPGEYTIVFAQFVSFAGSQVCGIVGSLQGGTGQISAEPGGSEFEVDVHTTDSAGLAADRDFQVFLRC